MIIITLYIIICCTIIKCISLTYAPTLQRICQRIIDGALTHLPMKIFLKNDLSLISAVLMHVLAVAAVIQNCCGDWEDREGGGGLEVPYSESNYANANANANVEACRRGMLSKLSECDIQAMEYCR